MSIFFKQCRFLKPWNNGIQCTKHFGKKNHPERINQLYWKLFFGAGVVSALAAFATTANYVDVKKRLPTSETGKEASLRDKFNFINKVVEKCAPAVVYVEIKDPRRIDKGTDGATIVSNGSGFIVREDGWILTNAHVVINKPHATVEVKLYDGSVYPATVEDADMNIDLALLKINADRKLSALSLARSGDVSVGEWVVALGSPLSLSHSATAGVVSSVSRNAEELGLRNYQMRYIQTDAPITFGNSGGPLVNLDGNVIGINNLRITAGISFAIPIEYVTKFLDHINIETARQKRSVSQTQLGLTTLTLTPSVLKDVLGRFKSLGDEVTHGVLVWKIAHGGIAAKGGLKVGDIITNINGAPVQKAVDVYYHLTDTNKTYDVSIIRSGQRMHLLIEPPNATETQISNKATN